MITRPIITGLLTTGSLLAVVLPVAAQAQADPSVSPVTAAPDQPPPATPAPDEAPGDIIVTATRQSQSLSKVPISISAFTQATLDIKGIKSFEDVARFTPGVRFDSTSNNISIRGISSGAGAGTTGIYIDDTPIQIRGLGFSSDNSLPAIFDLERVEVLRGPQGTLFGAGSEGGTVRYITPQPNLTAFSTYDRAEISTTAHGGISYEVGNAIGAPIVTDVLGFRISAWHRRDGGYIDHVNNRTGAIDDKDINHGDVTVLRGAITWQPTTGLRITPAIHYQYRTTNASDNFFVGLSDPERGVFRTSTPEYRGIRDEFYLPSLNARLDTNGISIISNTSYFDRKNITGYSGTLYDLSYYQSLYCRNPVIKPGSTRCPLYPFLTPTGINPALPDYLSPSVVTNRQRIFTQEVRVQSNDPTTRLTWVAGIFYQRSKQRSIEELVDPQGNAFFNAVFGESLESYFGYPLFGQDSYINDSTAIDKQIAGFADVTFAATEQLKLTAGARYAKTTFSVVNFADGSQNGSRTEGAGKSSEKPFTPKLGVNFQADRDNLFYFTWAKGFRAAGANPPVPVDPCSDSLADLGIASAPITYKSDTVSSFELGSKNRVLNRMLSIDASVYQVRWNDIQQIVNLPQCAIRFIANLGKAKSQGFDLQMTLTPATGLTIDGSLGYTHTRFTEDAKLAPNGGTVINSGNAIEGPPWTFAIGAQYSFPIGEQKFFLRGDVQYKSRLNAPTSERDPNSTNYDAALIAPDANTYVSLRAGTTVAGANLSLFVDNLLDSAPQLGYTHQDSDTVLFENATFRPRTIGVTLTYSQ